MRIEKYTRHGGARVETRYRLLTEGGITPADNEGQGYSSAEEAWIDYEALCKFPSLIIVEK
jgi:hypothetical protein